MRKHLIPIQRQGPLMTSAVAEVKLLLFRTDTPSPSSLLFSEIFKSRSRISLVLVSLVPM